MKHVIHIHDTKNSHKANKWQIIRHGEYIVHDIAFHYNRRKNFVGVNFVDLTEEVIAYARAHHIEGIIAETDIGALVAAAACERLQLVGPQVGSVFHCFSKLETRRIMQDSSPWFFVIDAREKSLPENITFPFYMKAPYSSLGLVGYTIDCQETWEYLQPKILQELQMLNEPLLPFIQKYISAETFPDACLPLMIAEEFIDGPQITIEGIAQQGNVMPTIITDTNFFDNNRLIDNFSLPTRQTKTAQTELVTLAKAHIKKSGYMDGLWNAEYVCHRGNWKLLEINPRSASVFARMYHAVYGYDIFHIAYAVSTGEKGDLPAKSRGVAAQCNIITTKEGRVAALFNRDISPPAPMHQFLLPDDLIIQRSEHGVVLGQIELFGKTYPEIKEKIDRYRQQAIK